jgi:hypothetical protein
MGLKFLHLPKSKQFEMVTRYYDPQHEAMREDQEHTKAGLEEKKPISYEANIKGKFRTSGNHYNSRMLKQAGQKSNIRLIYILIILCALFYFFLK